MVLDIGPGIKLESNGAREDVEHRTTRLAFRRSSSMVSRHVMAWRPGMNCSPAAGIHVKRRRRITPSPLDDGAANAGTAWFQGRNSYSGPVDFLEGFFNTLVGQEKSEFQYPVPGLVAASRIHTVRERRMAGCPYLLASYNGLQKCLKSPLLVQYRGGKLAPPCRGFQSRASAC